MCGIFSILNPDDTIHYEKDFKKGVRRGPEESKYNKINKSLIVGFHRLAINGLNSESSQPMEKNDCILICNGEIYNHTYLYTLLKQKPNTQSDCEIIIDLYKAYGIRETLDLLDGVFAFALYDQNLEELYVARDPYGVRPLYFGTRQYITKDDTPMTTYGFSSELKMITNHATRVEQFLPGHYMIFTMNSEKQYWGSYFIHQYITGYQINNNIKDIQGLISSSLIEAVKKRVENTERPIACLLSGGLDSSLITSLVCSLTSNKVKTFSIGLEGSEDLKYANIVAKYLGTEHTDIIVSEEDFLNAIPKVIYAIESYDTTTVRASVGNCLVAHYIKKHTDCKVIFNGDGSDEVTGGYMYFHNAPDSLAFDMECKRLLNDICFYDVERSDRSIASNGLEARTPFLDKNFVISYLSIPPEIRCHKNKGDIEKKLLRDSFKGYLPDEILYRKKEAFSDGVSKVTRSWHKIIDEFLQNQDIDMTIKYSHNQPKTREQYYYRNIFEKKFKGRGSIIPYFWMPKWCKGATDASARELNVYTVSR
jgi:asparagine synthase (glutamine-hydrolysing)